MEKLENSGPPINYYQQDDAASSDSHEDEASQIVQLAREFTNLSQKHTNNSLGPIPSRINPFIEADNLDPRLDPYSDKFVAREWAKHVLNLMEKENGPGQKLTAGVSFKNMGAYGYGTGSDYQKTVLNIISSTFSNIVNVRNKGTKIQILRNFNGVVKKGETCVVLGRPGR